MFWGTTPALNFFEELKITNNKSINILLIGGCDARHILKTIAKQYQHADVHLNFYVMELVPEVYAKQLLLLHMALQPMNHLGLAQKTRMFMETYGNSLVRPTTAKYLITHARNLINMLTNTETLKDLMPMVTIDVKYKERDYMENIFKFWSNDDKFEVLDYWDRRLRKYLGVRYDTRNAAFDWDLNMRLHYVGAKLINNQEYQSFRRNGVAFSWLEGEVTRTNRSMVTGIIPNGDHFGHYGYLGDMQTGPFISYGIECSDPEFTKKSNHTYKYRATDITERNLREIFHEIEFGTEYDHQITSSYTLGSTIMQIPEMKVVDSGNVRFSKTIKECFPLPHVDIIFMSLNNLSLMKHREKYKEFFDVVYFANNCVKHIDQEVLTYISKPESLVICESMLFNIGQRDKDIEEHFKSVEGKLEGLEKYVCPIDIKKDAYFKYVLKK